MPNPTNIYILHDPKDHVFLNSLETQMNVLKQQGVISIWSSSDLIAGSEVEKITSQKIADADLVLAPLTQGCKTPTHAGARFKP